MQLIADREAASLFRRRNNTTKGDTSSCLYNFKRNSFVKVINYKSFDLALSHVREYFIVRQRHEQKKTTRPINTQVFGWRKVRFNPRRILNAIFDSPG